MENTINCKKNQRRNEMLINDRNITRLSYLSYVSKMGNVKERSRAAHNWLHIIVVKLLFLIEDVSHWHWLDRHQEKKINSMMFVWHWLKENQLVSNVLLLTRHSVNWNGLDRFIWNKELSQKWLGGSSSSFQIFSEKCLYEHR
jgi:hypothetical protein